MRSSYWGQGGHNAILLVGDFFKPALDSGKLDPAAVFPGGRPPEPVRQHEEEPVEEMEEGGDLQQEGVPRVEPPVQVQPELPPEPEAEPEPETLPPPPQPQPQPVTPPDSGAAEI
jgi:penicillin-binding protein 1A